MKKQKRYEKKKKSAFMRICIICLAGAMLLGVITMPLIQLFGG